MVIIEILDFFATVLTGVFDALLQNTLSEVVSSILNMF